MVKRIIDIILSCVALTALAPLFAIVGLAIAIEDGRPVLYRARRAGRDGKEMTVYKFRSMGQGADRASKITAASDPRVTRVGAVIRKLKIDELPQLVNVFRGEMSIVGPRPEDVDVVEQHYAPEHMETLEMRPGLASPGSIYNYTHGEQALAESDHEATYLAEILPMKLALERYYVHNQSFGYDVRIIGRTIKSILLTGLAHRQPAPAPELDEAMRLYRVPARASEPAPTRSDPAA